MDVAAWLRQQGLGQYADAFADNHIDDVGTLQSLTTADLKELGVASLGHRKRLLLAIAAIEAAVPAPAAPVEGEQREATVLFADLSGFTQLSNALGAEAMHGLLNCYFDAADSVIEAYGGRVDKHMGDGLMAVFGAPLAHGDDQERAVRAALDIHDAVRRVGEQEGRELRVHIGVASGSVVASGTGSATHQEYTVIGDAVNLAARLQDLAGAGETLISDRLRQVVGARIEAVALDPVALKGLAAPAGVWRVTGLRDAGGGALPLVGREAELASFAAMLDAVAASRFGQAVLLRGDAGIGKSRLLRAFADKAEATGFTVHGATVLDFGAGRGRDAIRPLLRSMLGAPGAADQAARQAIAERTLAQGLLEEAQRPYLLDLLEMPQPAGLRALYDAMDDTNRRLAKRRVMADLVGAVSAVAPLLLLVEDIHWASPTTLDYLQALAEAVQANAAILVMTTRSEGDPLDAAWRAGIRQGSLLTIDLGPLGEAEALALANAYSHATQRLIAECVARAEGNPLFLEQLLANAGESSRQEIPASIQSLVLARLDRLPAHDRRALQAAAVIGQQFTLQALRALLDQPAYSAAGLVAQGLLRPEGESYAFVHALIRDGVYASLLSERRQALHLHAAALFAEQDPIRRAEHLHRGGDPGAAFAYLQAAHLLSANFRDQGAMELVERGREVARQPGERFALLAFEGQLRRKLGQPAASITAYEQALALAADERQRCAVWIGMAAAMRIVDRLEEALSALDQAELIATRNNMVIELAELHNLRGNLHFPQGLIEECHEEHQTALDYARQAGSLELEAAALSGLADANSLRARIGTAHNCFHRALVIARANGFTRIEVANRPMRGIMRYYQNDLEGALEDCLEGGEGAGRIGHHRAEMVARAAAGYVLTELGRNGEARVQCELALDLARTLGARRFEASSLRHLGRVLAASGDRSAALEALESSLAIAREAGLSFSGPWALGAIALVTADPKRRQAALDEGERLLDEGGPFHNYFWFYRDGMEVGLLTRDWALVARHAAALEAFTRMEPVPWTSFFIERGRALAARGRGENDAALQARLRRLLEAAKAAGLVLAIPALQAALDGPGADGGADAED